MNVTIYATILTGLGIIITLVVTMHNLSKANQQETNRRIDDLKTDLRELLDAKFKVIDSQFEVVNVRVQKLDREVTEARQEVQDFKRVIFKPAT
jgi:peptidoglycan hydrolase CwlO-like protein